MDMALARRCGRRREPGSRIPSEYLEQMAGSEMCWTGSAAGTSGRHEIKG